MKTYKYTILTTLLLLLASCQKELDLVEIQNNQPDAVVEKTIDNGRFVFSTKESLKVTIEELQSEPIEKVEQEFENLYEKGFRSHKPIVNPKNELLQAKLSEDIMQKRQLKKSHGLYSKNNGEEDEDEDEFIGDPLLAALVNDNTKL